MSSTFIGPELENNENETEEPKVDNFEEDQGSDLLKEKEKEKNLASITSTIFFAQLTKQINQKIPRSSCYLQKKEK